MCSEIELKGRDMMQIKSNKIYIDYLDYTVGFHSNAISPDVRLRFDLLLFSEDVLCMSVPACVKLESTTQLLMFLTPFWRNGKIRLILDRKHRNNPWNYFNNRNKVLEKGFPEERLIHHFEYSAYHSPHTQFFYDSYIHEVIPDRGSFFIEKIFDTDEMFRQSVISQSVSTCEKICSLLPVNQAIHMGRIFNDLIIISEDRNSLFQRSAVESNLINTFDANNLEVAVIRRILDKGFAYANGISSYAAPISQITNRLTGATIIPILRAADKELYGLICKLDWNSLYRLSINELWLDFVDHLNTLLLVYRDCNRHHHPLPPPSLLECGMITTEIINSLYKVAIDSLQQELLKNGLPFPDVIRTFEYTELLFESYLQSKSKYWNAIKEINALLPAIKTFLGSLSRKRKDNKQVLEQQGYIITMDNYML